MSTYITRGAGDAGLAILIGLIVGLIAASLLPAGSRTQPASAAPAAFSHEDCQYPNRWSNPAEGCDNSDPAVPECTKAWETQAAEQACIADFVKQHEAAAAPVTTTPATAAPATNTCGGTK